MPPLVSTVRVFDRVVKYSIFRYQNTLVPVSDNIEQFRKHVLSIILPGKSYFDRLSFTSLNTVTFMTGTADINLPKRLLTVL